MPGTRLFNPSDSLSGRDPLSDVIDDGMIVNPPRFAELGGLNEPGKAFKNKLEIKKPASTIRKVPIT
jgi:hypothetical protein